MNIFDVVFALLFCGAVYSGAKRGLIMQATALLSILLGVYIAVKFSGMLASWITGFGVGTQAVFIASFALTFVGILILSRLLGHVGQKIVQLALLGWLNRLLGVVFSLAKMTLVISITLLIVNTVDRELHFMPRDQVEKSKLYTPISRLAPLLLPYLDFGKLKSTFHELDRRMDKTMEEFR